jgi:hypothetical protein
MGFPGSVFSFTNKSAGQTIQSATINDLQNELTAVENALVNGPLTLPASTVASLSVAGGSTFVGAVTMTGGIASTASFASSVTFSSGVTINGAMAFGSSGSFTMPRAFVCRLTNSAAQNVNSGAFTGLNWDTETYDPSGVHSTSANSSRITFGSTGIWLVGASVEWSNGSTAGLRSLRIDLNDATHLGGSVAPGGGGADAQSVAVQLNVTAVTDWVTAVVFQTSGSTNSVGVGANYGTAFWAQKITG